MTSNDLRNEKSKVKLTDRQTNGPTDGWMDGQSGLYSRVHATKNRVERAVLMEKQTDRLNM